MPFGSHSNDIMDIFLTSNIGIQFKKAEYNLRIYLRKRKTKSKYIQFKMSYQTHLNLSLLNYDQFVFKSFYILYIEHLHTYQKLKIQIFQFDGIKIFRTVSDNQIVIVLFSRITSTLFQIFRCRCRYLSFFL